MNHLNIRVFLLFQLQINVLLDILFPILAQIQIVRQDTSSAGEFQYNKTDKDFDCFMECIKDTTCRRLSRIHPHTNPWTDCFKKTSTLLSALFLQDAQYAIIKGILVN